ncbi:SDR family NAD(P)-dependent oxidoreductase [Jannaschia aquimarina]|uniref:RhlG protein n=1 Tax=Jannaschia aquimarina TaxID=935700 RepID=A0A0D1EMD0_9RHOB|nr:SDR family NAD(P)-dependent oxidoreductase [Jannaschia aquimarina]KIT16825.1 Rhamnolipids biosynthesis 3-oxoacyl-[acyl-carrier-protein] reductase [Jannaschia aquimarina]SNT13488.1 Short-chain dehydrogenase [Jannaschia aquimarina]
MTRRVLVTGGNRGIGRAIAAGLVEQGLDVILTSRDAEAGAEVAREIGARSQPLDLMSEASIQEAVARSGEVDVLVNNAGVLWDEGLFEDPDHFEASMGVMVRAPYLLMRALLPGMEARGYGRVVNLSSGWGSFAEGIGGGGAYGVAKAALNALTVRAAGTAPTGVKINAMCPGWVRTRMGGASATRSPEEGAETAIWLATLSEDGPTGGFFRDRRPIAW